MTNRTRISGSLLAVAVVLGVLFPANAGEGSLPLDGLYRKAQREFQRKNYARALPLLQSYVEKSKKQRYKRERLFWVIDQIGRIYLRERRDPDGALKFFGTLSKDRRLDHAEFSVIEGWTAAANEWKKMGQLEGSTAPADKLYETGEKFYRKGLAMKKFPADDAGNAHFHIAATYLVPFVVHHDADSRIGEALYMMGDIRRHSLTDKEYWSDNFYLREVIRRFPHTPLARRAYALLETEVRLGYTGSSGDNTPPSMVRMLRWFKQLAEPAEASE